MRQKTIILIIIGIILSCTPFINIFLSASTAATKEQQGVWEFLTDLQKAGDFKGKLPVSRIREEVSNKGRVQELYKGFDEHCLGPFKNPVTTKTLRDSNCFAAVNTLGVIGGRAGLDAKLKIDEFIKKFGNINSHAKKVGRIALSNWVNTMRKEENINTLIPLQGDVSAESEGALSEIKTQMGLACMEILKCLPLKLLPSNNSLPSKSRVRKLKADLETAKKHCPSPPLDLKKESDRDEVREKLTGFALTGLDEATELFEELLKNAKPGSSSYAFIKELYNTSRMSTPHGEAPCDSDVRKGQFCS